MRLISDTNKVERIVTRNGWIYRVIPGSFQTATTPEGEVWFKFRSHQKGKAVTVTILMSDVASVVEIDE